MTSQVPLKIRGKKICLHALLVRDCALRKQKATHWVLSQVSDNTSSQVFILPFCLFVSSLPKHTRGATKVLCELGSAILLEQKGFVLLRAEKLLSFTAKRKYRDMKKR